jgi:hypothetical protein
MCAIANGLSTWSQSTQANAKAVSRSVIESKRILGRLIGRQPIRLLYFDHLAQDGSRLFEKICLIGFRRRRGEAGAASITCFPSAPRG